MKKIFSFLMAALFSATMFADTQLYLRVSTGDDGWNDVTKFAIYYFNDTENGWSNFLTPVANEANLYTGTIPAGFSQVIFTRHNPAAETPDWGTDGSNRWSQTTTQTIPTTGEDLFTITGGGRTWDCTGEWSVYTPSAPVETVKFKVAGSMNNWDPSQTLSYKDTLVLALEAGDYQFKVVDGSDWIGFANLTDTAANLYQIQGNVCFTLAAAQNVKIIYKAGELFKVEGTFVLPTVKIAGIQGWETAEHVALTPAVDGKTASATVNLTEEKDYQFKVVEAGNWLSLDGEIKDGDTALYVIKSDWTTVSDLYNNKHNFKLQTNIIPGEYTFTWNYAKGELVVTFPVYVPTLTNGYYLVGDKYNWTPAAERLFVANPEAEGEFVLDSIVLAVDDSIKVAKVENDNIITWYPDGDNYVIDEQHAGKKNIYFRPDYYALWDGNIYIAPNPAPATPKFYVTGDSAFVKDAGSEAGEWNPQALASYDDTLKLNLKAMQLYSFKVLPDGSWEEGHPIKGYDELSVKPDGVNPDNSRNICFKLAEAGQVNIIYKDGELFKVEGNFYAPKKTVKLVPNAWAADNAKMAAWIWGGGVADQWTGFFAGTGDTLSVQVPEATDSIIFARFAPKVETPSWDLPDTLRWNSVVKSQIDNVGLTYTITDWSAGTWEVYIPVKFKIAGSMSSWDDESQFLVSYEDTLVMALEAGIHEFKLVTPEGPWLGFDTLTEVTTGLYKNEQYGNIMFKLNEAGNVKVTYTKDPYVFKVEGTFAPAPAPVETVKFKVAGSMNNWDASQTPSYKDTLVLALEAGDYQFKVVDGDDWIGFNALTDTAANLYQIQGNVCFTLTAAQNVKIIYKAGELFKVEGTFVLPTVKIAGIQGWETAEHVALTPAVDGKTASAAVNLTEEKDYQFKVVIAGNWLSLDGEIKDGDTALYVIKSDWTTVSNLENNKHNFKLQTNIIPGEYTFTWNFVKGELVVTFPEYVPVLANGYYLIGPNWAVEDIVAANKFTVNPDNENEYQLDVTLAENQKIKVVEVENDAIKAWYPDGSENEYTVDAQHAGEKTIYFQTTYKEDWAAFGGYFYIPGNTTGIENTVDGAKAVKTLENGILIIEKAGVKYNVMGQKIQ